MLCLPQAIGQVREGSLLMSLIPGNQLFAVVLLMSFPEKRIWHRRFPCDHFFAGFEPVFVEDTLSFDAFATLPRTCGRVDLAFEGVPTSAGLKRGLPTGHCRGNCQCLLFDSGLVVSRETSESGAGPSGLAEQSASRLFASAETANQTLEALKSMHSGLRRAFVTLTSRSVAHVRHHRSS